MPLSLATRRLAFTLVGALALSACDHDEAKPASPARATVEPKAAPPPPAPLPASPVASGLPAAPREGDDDDAGPDYVPVGSPVISLRTIDLAIYLKAPAPAALVSDITDKVHARFPAATLLKKPSPAPPPTVVVFSPDLDELPVPSADELSRFGRDLTPLQVETAQRSKGAIVFSWLLDADPTYAELRKAETLVHEVAQKNGGFLWDDTTRELFSTDSWKKARLDGWQGDVPDARRHFTTHYYESETELGRRHRAVTLGLAKLGLPDLVVEDLPPPLWGAMKVLLDAVAQELVEGAPLLAEGKLLIDIKAIHHGAAKSAFVAAAAPNATFRGHVSLGIVDPEEGDADNRLAEVRFDGYPGKTESERQAAGLGAILGDVPAVPPVSPVPPASSAPKPPKP